MSLSIAVNFRSTAVPGIPTPASVASSAHDLSAVEPPATNHSFIQLMTTIHIYHNYTLGRQFYFLYGKLFAIGDFPLDTIL